MGSLKSSQHELAVLIPESQQRCHQLFQQVYGKVELLDGEPGIHACPRKRATGHQQESLESEIHYRQQKGSFPKLLRGIYPMPVELLLTSDKDYNNLMFLHYINSQSDSFRRLILTYKSRAACPIIIFVLRLQPWQVSM